MISEALASLLGFLSVAVTGVLYLDSLLCICLNKKRWALSQLLINTKISCHNLASPSLSLFHFLALGLPTSQDIAYLPLPSLSLLCFSVCLSRLPIDSAAFKTDLF